MILCILCMVACAALACGGMGDDTSPRAAGGAKPAGASPQASSMDKKIVPDIEARVAKFSPTPLQADLSALSASDRKVLGLLIEASRQMDPIYLRQVWAGNPELQREIAGWKGKEAEAARRYFDLNAGPWDRLDGVRPFIDD
jgi:hypothetical protein